MNPEDLTTTGVVNAYCYCLSPAHSVQLLKRIIIENLNMRNVALKKVCKDMETAFLRKHENLIVFLISEFEPSDPRKRQSLAYCLHILSNSAPPNVRHKVLGFLITSNYISVRRRAYRSLMEENAVPVDMVITAWQNYRDYECAWLIINKFSIQYLIENHVELSDFIQEPWRLSKLYLKIGAIQPKLLTKLKMRDGISYAYVMAKLSKNIPYKEALDIIENNLSDDRFGLLLWSLGQLKNRKALEYIEGQIPKINQLRLDSLLKGSTVNNRFDGDWD